VKQKPFYQGIIAIAAKLVFGFEQKLFKFMIPGIGWIGCFILCQKQAAVKYGSQSLFG
jgi:hypothetical protein